MNPWRARATRMAGDPTSERYRAWVEQTREIQRQQENRKAIPMGKYRTKRGDQIDLPVTPNGLRDQAAKVFEAAVEAFDAIQTAKAREARMNQAPAADARRFPVIKES